MVGSIEQWHLAVVLPKSSIVEHVEAKDKAQIKSNLIFRFAHSLVHTSGRFPIKKKAQPRHGRIKLLRSFHDDHLPSITFRRGLPVVIHSRFAGEPAAGLQIYHPVSQSTLETVSSNPGWGRWAEFMGHLLKPCRFTMVWRLQELDSLIGVD